MRSALALLGLAAAVSAQVVVPTAAEGNALDGLLGYDKVRVVQQIPPSMLPASMTIRGIDFRRDGRALPGRTIRYDWWHHEPDHRIEVALGRYTPEARVTGLFAPDGRTVVLARERFRLPDLPDEGAPAPWRVALPLDAPYAYTGGGLAIDVTIGHPRWNDYSLDVYALDAHRGRGGGISVVSREPRDLRAYATANEAYVSLTCYGMDPYGVAVLLVGIERPFAWLDVAPVWLGAVAAWSTGSAEIRLPWVPGVRDVAVQWWTPPLRRSNVVVLDTGPPAIDGFLVYGIGSRSWVAQGLVDDRVCLAVRLR